MCFLRKTIIGSHLCFGEGIAQCLFNLLYYVVWWLDPSATRRKYQLSKAPCKRTQHRWQNNSQLCWMLHVASVYTPCCMLLGVVACCCAKSETGQTFSCEQTDATTPNDVGSCWPTLLHPFAHGLTVQIRKKATTAMNMLGMQKGANFTTVCTILLIGLKSKS